MIENVSGIRMIVKNAGRASSRCSKSICFTLRNIYAPIRSSTTAVAYGGTIPARGARKRHGKKQTAQKIAVQPVRPPISMPAMLSIYAVPGDDPNNPALNVANESTTSPRCRFFGSPFSSSSPAACDTPINVDNEDNESKRSVNIIAMIVGSRLSFNAPKMSSLNIVL